MPAVDAGAAPCLALLTGTEPEFVEGTAGLKRELAATTILEVVLIELIVVALGRLRRALAGEAEGGDLDAARRLRVEAERSFWRAFHELNRGRRAADRARHAEEPAPVELAPTPPAPNSAPAQPQPTGPRRRLHLERHRATGAARPNLDEFLSPAPIRTAPIMIAPMRPQPTIDPAPLVPSVP